MASSLNSGLRREAYVKTERKIQVPEASETSVTLKVCANQDALRLSYFLLGEALGYTGLSWGPT